MKKEISYCLLWQLALYPAFYYRDVMDKNKLIVKQ